MPRPPNTDGTTSDPRMGLPPTPAAQGRPGAKGLFFSFFFLIAKLSFYLDKLFKKCK